MLDTEELATIGFSLLFPLLYTKGPSWVSFYTKFVIYYTSMTLSATVCLPFTLLRPKDPRNLLWTTYFMKKTAKLLGIEWTFVDPIDAKLKLSKTSGPAVVIVNHQSSIDVLALLCELWPMMDGKCTVIAKKSLLYTGPFGFMAFMSGITFIDRYKNLEARQSMEQTAQKCKEENWKLIVFPEGTRHHCPNELLNFKLGAFSAAVAAQLPIQPVVFSHYDFYQGGQKKVWHPGGVRIHTLEPIKTTEETDVKNLAVVSRQNMLDIFQEDYQRNFT